MSELTPEQKKQAEDNGISEDRYKEMLRTQANKTYEGKCVDIGRNLWMVDDDQGRPPRPGAKVIVNGQEATVISSRYNMSAAGKHKFTVQFAK